MIEMTNAELLNAFPALQEMVGLPMPAVASLKVARIARAVEAAAQEIGQVRQQTIDRYTERDPAGNPVPVVDADGTELSEHIRLTDPAAFNAEMNALMAASTFIPVEPLRAEELGTELQISPRSLLLLGSLVQLDHED